MRAQKMRQQFNRAASPVIKLEELYKNVEEIIKRDYSIFARRGLRNTLEKISFSDAQLEAISENYKLYFKLKNEDGKTGFWRDKADKKFLVSFETLNYLIETAASQGITQKDFDKFKPVLQESFEKCKNYRPMMG